MDEILKIKDKPISVIFCDSKIKNVALQLPCRFKRREYKHVMYVILFNSAENYENTIVKGLTTNQYSDLNSIKLKRMVDEAIVNRYSDGKFKLRMSTRQYPAIFGFFTQNVNVVGLLGTILFFMPISLFFIYLLN